MQAAPAAAPAAAQPVADGEADGEVAPVPAALPVNDGSDIELVAEHRVFRHGRTLQHLEEVQIQRYERQRQTVESIDLANATPEERWEQHRAFQACLGDTVRAILAKEAAARAAAQAAAAAAAAKEGSQ